MQEIADHAARDSSPTSCTTLEVGPGPGGLTKALLEQGARVVAIERDTQFSHVLERLQKTYGERLALIVADACQTDMSPFSPMRVVANLPYNVATVLLVQWLKRIHLLSSMTLMFQKEVAERITAPVGGKAYGRLSVLCQWLCRTQMRMILPAKAFVPPPRVDSALVSLIPLQRTRACSFESMEILVKAAFSARRKMLRNALQSLCLVFDIECDALCAEGGVSSDLRAENVPVEAYERMAVFLEEKMSYHESL